MNKSNKFSNCIAGCGLALGLFVPLAGAHAQATTLYMFTGGNDGGNPPCGLISGGKGALPAAKVRFYGTTQEGGTSGYGTVFAIGKTNFETVLYSFTGGSDGSFPAAGLIADAAGNLYGTTEVGGAYGYGVVFKLTPGGTETVLHSFTGGSDGAYPVASLIMDASGNLYGTTEQGGADDFGVVFEVPSGSSETVLHSFAGSDGAYSTASLAMDASGNLYGTTEAGGGGNGNGVVFKLTGSTETVLHAFTGGSDGATPLAGVILDKGQDIFGTTLAGGSSDAGTVFEISHKGKETVLHSFGSGSDGSDPLVGLIKKGGDLYGTTLEGGTSGVGTVFRTPIKKGSETVLYSFTGGSDGGLPHGAVLDQAGSLFGTTFGGGDSGCSAGEGCGVVFEIAP